MFRSLTIAARMLSTVVLGLFAASRPSLADDRPPPAEVVPAMPGVPAGPAHKLLGTARCIQCHNAEYNAWWDRDPHRGAYAVLLNERSRRMVALLRYPQPAHESERCLSCHAMPADRTHYAQGSPGFVGSDGVSCEVCHGPSSHWIDEHMRWSLPGATVSDAQRAALGFTPLKDIQTRAATCAGCHVGSPAAAETCQPWREVDHDLIAAGHPRLGYEFSGLHANLPKHWHFTGEKAREKSRGSLLEARLWAVGQAEWAAAFVRLMEARLASQANANEQLRRPLPEFAEFDCYACHHDLQDEAWRQSKPIAAQGGFPEWGAMHLSTARWLAGESRAAWGVEGEPVIAGLAKLVDGANARPLGGSTGQAGAAVLQERAADARQLVASLEAWSSALNQARHDAASSNRLLESLRGNAAATVRQWDTAAQAYSAYYALVEATREGQPPSAYIREFVNLLRFPAEQGADGKRVPRADGPVGFDPARVRALLEQAGK